MLAILKKILKVLLYTVGGIIALILMVAITPIIFGLFTSDIPPIDDSDLRLKKIVVAKEDNAYYDLKKIEEIYDELKEVKDEGTLLSDHLDGKTWDAEFVKEILARNQEAMTLFNTAAGRPKYQLPELADPEAVEDYFNIEFPHFLVHRKFARLSALKAYALAKQGRAADALDQALTSVKIGQLMQNSQEPLITHMTAVMMKSIGLQATRQIIASSDLPKERLKGLVRQLNAFYDNEAGMISSFKFEYQAIAQGITTNILSGETPKSSILKYFPVYYKFYFRPNETKSILADYFRIIIKNISRPWSELEEIDINDYILIPSLKLYYTENALGRILFSIAMPKFDGYIARNFTEDMQVAVTQTLAALKAYKNDKGNLPDSLDELTPDYINAVPNDPFDGKPIKYSAEKMIIYSVGEDMTDTGGSESKDEDKNLTALEDPTFTIDF